MRIANSPTPNLSENKFENKGIEITAITLTAIALFFSILQFFKISFLNPHGQWDAWAIWNLRAKFIARSSIDLKIIFSNLANHTPWSHIDYPLLLPGTIARFWEYLGSQSVQIPILVAFLFTILTAGLIFSSLSILKNKTRGALAALVLITSPFWIYGTWQYADVPLALYFLATTIILSFIDYFKFTNAKLFILLGLFSSLAIWTKNEGLFFFLALVFLLIAFSFFNKSSSQFRKGLLMFIVSALPVIIVIFLFKFYFAKTGNDIYSLARLNDITAKLTDFSRYLKISTSFSLYLKQLFPSSLLAYIGLIAIVNNQVKEKKWMFLVLTLGLLYLGYLQMFLFPFCLLILFLIKALRIDMLYQRSFMIISLVLITTYIGYFFTYVITPRDLDWHLSTSLDRLIVQLMPSFIFFIFLIPFPEKLSYSKIPLNEKSDE
jgi:hypothetical protein